MKILITYISKTGFTKRYAEWIADDITADIISFDKITSESISKYDLIIFGSAIHAGRIGGFKKARKIMESANKTFIVFATGAMPAAFSDTVEDMWKNNLSAEERKAIPCYYFQSGLNYEKMSGPNRFLMKGFASAMRKKKDKTEEEKGLADALSQSYDISSREQIVPLVLYVKKNK